MFPPSGRLLINSLAFSKMLDGVFASSLAFNSFDLNLWLKSEGHHSIMQDAGWVVVRPLSSVLKRKLCDSTTNF